MSYRRGCTLARFGIGTKFNTAENPTRDAPVRPPCAPYPLWARSIPDGDFALLDERARDLTYDATAPSLSDLAPACKIWDDADLPTCVLPPTPEMGVEIVALHLA